MRCPEIRFRHPWLLIDAVYDDVKDSYKKTGDLEKLGSEFIKKNLNRYEKAWRPYEKRIINGMCDLLDLEFKQNIIDVYAAPLSNSFSDPMFIATKYKSDRFIEVITHELIHRLLTDNIKTNPEAKYTKEWQRLFGKNHSWNTLVHIPVHAVMQAIFEDVLDEPERTQKDKQKVSDHEAYKAAWDYVEEVGYREIVAKLKASYNSLSEKSDGKETN